MQKTYLDFPNFYSHPFIKSIAEREKWSVSDKTKRPIDIKALIYDHEIYGARMDEIENSIMNPCVNLSRLCEILPNATNNVYYLNAIADKFVVLDIEPKCPDDIKNELLNTNYIYGEISMSGNGYHLIYPLPDCIKEYPIAMKKVVMKEEHGYYEILMNHWVTFTRNMIPESQPDANNFEDVFRELARQQKENAKKDVDMSELEPESIPNIDYITSILIHCAYKKSPDDFYGDISKYEYGYMGFLHYNLCKLCEVSHIKAQHTYAPHEKAWILYTVAKDMIPYRDKHDECRDNLPWLLYLAREIVAKSDNLTKKTKGTKL